MGFPRQTNERTKKKKTNILFRQSEKDMELRIAPGTIEWQAHCSIENKKKNTKNRNCLPPTLNHFIFFPRYALALSLIISHFRTTVFLSRSFFFFFLRFVHLFSISHCCRYCCIAIERILKYQFAIKVT